MILTHDATTRRRTQPRIRGALWIALCGSLWSPVSGCRMVTIGEARSEPERTQARIALNPTRSHVALLPLGHDPVSVTVEVAQNHAARQRGLMYRKQLAPDAGMLFLFEREEHQSFWMHNTLIPLDILFIRADWTVLGIVENAAPHSDRSHSVPGISKYVLEVNAGFSRRHRLQAGTRTRYIPAGGT